MIISGKDGSDVNINEEIKYLKNHCVVLGETDNTAYPGNKGAANATYVARIKKSLGPYSERPDIVLTAKETNVAISADGVKVRK